MKNKLNSSGVLAKNIRETKAVLIGPTVLILNKLTTVLSKFQSASRKTRIDLTIQAIYPR